MQRCSGPEACQGRSRLPRRGEAREVRTIDPLDPDDITAADDLAGALALEADLRRAREIELAEERRRADAAEEKLAALRQTLSFMIGQAIVEARNLRGLLRLPARIIAAIHTHRSRRAASRREDRAAEGLAGTLRLVAAARERAAVGGLDAGRRWLAARPGSRADKARALAELALDHLAEDPQAAAAAGEQAVALFRREPRLWRLVDALYSQGLVQAPARILASLSVPPPSPSYRQLAEEIEADATLLAGDTHPTRSRAGRGDRIAVVCAHAQPWHDDLPAWRAQAVVEAARKGGRGACLVVPAADATAEQMTRHVAEDGLEILRVPWSGEGRGAAATRYREALEQVGPAFVHLILTDRAFDDAVLAAVSSLGLPLIVDVGVVEPWLLGEEAAERTQAARARLQAIGHQAERVVARTPALRQRLAAVGVDAMFIEDRLPTLAAPDEAMVADLRSELGLNTEARVIACVLPLEPDPGLDRLIDSLPGLPKDITLLVVGSGAARLPLEQRAAQLAVTRRVLFAGPALPGDLSAVLGLAAALLLPREGEVAVLSDATGAAAAAASLGVPIVATAAEADAIAGTAAAAHLVIKGPAELAGALASLRPAPRVQEADPLPALHAALRRTLA